MKPTIIILLLVILIGCEKSTSDPKLIDPPTVVNTITYTNENTFAQSFAGNGFKNPSQLVLKRTALSAGYNTVYGFAIPAANQVKGFKWDFEDEQTEEWRPQGITGFTWQAKTI